MDDTGVPPADFDLRTAYDYCTKVTAFCRVEFTTLGYFPNRAFNYFFAISFGLAGLVNLILGTWKKTWSYTAFITLGCFLEMAGYAARIPLSDNPFNHQAFETSLIAIILAPTLISVSIYLTLKHVCLALGPSLSRVRPRSYPFIFVPADLSCLVLQAIGGGIAASARYDMGLLQHGNRTIIAGIAMQVVVLLFFGLVAGDYYLHVRRWMRSEEARSDVGADAVALWKDAKFRVFVYAVVGAYSGILIRCIYRCVPLPRGHLGGKWLTCISNRIAEMAGGWGNPIMQDEPSFIALEGL